MVQHFNQLNLFFGRWPGWARFRLWKLQRWRRSDPHSAELRVPKQETMWSRQFFVRNQSTSAAFSISCHDCRGQVYTETDGRSNAKKWPTRLVFILPKSHTEPVFVASSNTIIVFLVHFSEVPILVSFGVSMDFRFWDTSTCGCVWK